LKVTITNHSEVFIYIHPGFLNLVLFPNFEQKYILLIDFRYDWRLAFENLKDNANQQNVIDEEERKKIWIPNLVFENSLRDAFIQIDDLSSLKVMREGQPRLSLNQYLQENEEFLGANNPLVYSRNYDLPLWCEFELHYFPFDHQQCYLTVSYLKLYTLS
jgi:hypothetical protein